MNMKANNIVGLPGLPPQTAGTFSPKHSSTYFAFTGNTFTLNPIKQKWQQSQVSQAVLTPRTSISQLKRDLKHGNPSVRANARHALNILISKCIAAIHRSHPDTAVRESAARALGLIGSSAATNVLSAAIQGPQKDIARGVREAAVHALGLIRDDQAITALLGALSDVDSDVRLAAVNSLFQMRKYKDKRIVPAFIAMMHGPRRDTCPLVKREIIFALERLGDARAAPVLISYLSDRDVRARELAAKALGTFKDPRARPRLIQILIGPKQDPHTEVRRHAAIALGEIKGSHATAALMKLIHGTNRDPRSGVRLAAVWGLSNILSPASIPALVKALRDPFNLIRSSAAKLLGKLRARQAIPALKALLTDRDQEVREAAAAALRRI